MRPKLTHNILAKRHSRTGPHGVSKTHLVVDPSGINTVHVYPAPPR